MKIAYFSPLNPIKSGISDYSEELLEYLAGYGRIDLFVDDYKPTNHWLCECFNVRDYHEIFENHGRNDYDIHIYHMGNSDNHSYIYPVMLDYPGIVVLHEPMLHHFVFSQTVGNNRLRDYLRELDYCYKMERADIVKTTLEERDEQSWYDFPLVDRIVDSSLGVIVHSEFARRQVLSVNQKANVRKIPSHFSPMPSDRMRSPELLRQVLGFDREDFLVGYMGYINDSKQIDVILRVIAKLRGEGYPIKLLLVGKMLAGCEVQRWIDDLQLDEDVLVAGFVDTKTFWEYLNVPDACVALRYPSAGETSASVIKMMGVGKPVIMTDYQAFSEFPDDCCVKVATTDLEENLERSLIRLMKNKEETKAIGRRAKKYIAAHHDIKDSAKSYVEFAWEILTGNGH